MYAIKPILSTLVAFVLPVSPFGCGGTERQAQLVTTTAAGKPMQCRMCYDMTVRVLTGPPKHKRYEIVQNHQCPDCRSYVIIYTERGEMKIKCAHCAPDGIACDRCLPPGDMTASSRPTRSFTSNPTSGKAVALALGPRLPIITRFAGRILQPNASNNEKRDGLFRVRRGVNMPK